MNEDEKKLLLYNALDQIYAGNEIHETFDFYCIKTIFLNDTYISIKDNVYVKISLNSDGINISIDMIDFKIRYDSLINFSFWIEA